MFRSALGTPFQHSSKSGILDKVSGAVASYGLSKLSRKYNGACLRVRRSNDNAETDVGFVTGLPRKRIYNALTNGNFEFGTLGVTTVSSSISASAGVLTNTASGASAYPACVPPSSLMCLTGKKIYAKATVRVTNSVATGIYLYADGSTGGSLIVTSAPTPTQNQWYPLSGIIPFGATHTGVLQLKIRQYYADAVTATGKVMEVKNCVVVDMGIDTSNPLYNYTTAQMDALVGNYVNAFGFESGEIDYRSLLTFLGANGGFVTKWYDQSNLANHAVQTIAVSQPRICSSGIVDDGLYFDGTDDFLIPPSSASLDIINAPLSLFANFNTSSTLGAIWLFSKNLDTSATTQYSLGYYGPNLAVITFVEGVELDSTTGILANTPYKACFSWDNAMAQIYTNGVFSTQVAKSLTLTSRPNVTIGARGNTGGTRIGFFKGNMKSIAILTKALTQAQINQLQGGVI